MITVAMGDSDANEMRVWFDRAIEGQLDLQSAWNRMQTGLLPRWHGNHAALLAMISRRRIGWGCAVLRRGFVQRRVAKTPWLMFVKVPDPVVVGASARTM